MNKFNLNFFSRLYYKMVVQTLINTLFQKHPESVGETYWEHGKYAIQLGGKLITFGVAEITHAIIPSINFFEICNTSSTICLENIVNELKERNSKIKKEE